MRRPVDILLDELPGPPQILWRAPGRANLIGEHTDYNDGLVLPIALDLAVYVGGRPAETIRLRSLQEGEAVEVDPATGRGPHEGWGVFVTAVVSALLDEGVRVRGFEGVVTSNLPPGAGLSSSAALEVAVACAVVDESVPPRRLALICQKAENDYVGMRCGIMDQMASMMAVTGSGLLLDCRSFDVRNVPIPPDIAFVAIDSGVSRELSSSGYNRRRAECEQAAAELGVRTLRDATIVTLDESDLNVTLRKRAKHVITENQRVLEVERALREGDHVALASAFRASHASLSKDFEVSTPELDELVSIARQTDGVLASRMTGGGFGGCTINLVEADVAARAARSINNAYRDATGNEARWWVSSPSGGAAPVEL
jgi:galactokinase